MPGPFSEAGDALVKWPVRGQTAGDVSRKTDRKRALYYCILSRDGSESPECWEVTSTWADPGARLSLPGDKLLSQLAEIRVPKPGPIPQCQIFRVIQSSESFCMTPAEVTTQLPLFQP